MRRSSGDSRRNMHVAWDEKNLEENEAIQAQFTGVTIPEPKTPYHGPLGEQDSEDGGGMQPLQLDGVLNAFEYHIANGEHSGWTTSNSNSEAGTSRPTSSGSEGEGSEKKRRFAAMRTAHYNMKTAMQRARELLSSEDGEEGVSGGRGGSEEEEVSSEEAGSGGGGGGSSQHQQQQQQPGGERQGRGSSSSSRPRRRGAAGASSSRAAAAAAASGGDIGDGVPDPEGLGGTPPEGDGLGAGHYFQEGRSSGAKSSRRGGMRSAACPPGTSSTQNGVTGGSPGDSPGDRMSGGGGVGAVGGGSPGTSGGHSGHHESDSGVRRRVSWADGSSMGGGVTVGSGHPLQQQQQQQQQQQEAQEGNAAAAAGGGGGGVMDVDSPAH